MSTQTVPLDDLKAFVAGKAAADAGFRADLLADPKAAVEALLKTDLPGHVAIQVVEEAPDTYVVVLPAAQAADGELTDADLESVAGGAGKAVDKDAARKASHVFGAGIALGLQIASDVAMVTGDRNGARYHNDSKTVFNCGQ